MDKSEDKPKYEIVEREHEGQLVEMRLYPSGVIQRYNSQGKWVFATGTANVPFNSETGKDAAITRWENYQEAAMRGFQEATGRSETDEAIQEFTKAITTHAIDGGKSGAGYTKHARELVGLVAPQNTQSALTDAQGNQISGSPEFIRETLARLLAEKESREG